MDFLDKVASVSKEVAQSVAKTTGDLYDKGKAKIIIAQAQGEMRDIFREFGEYMYKAEKAGSVDEAVKADYVAKADEFMKKIEDCELAEQQLKEQIAKSAVEKSASTSQPCPSCGADRVEDNLFCGICGTKF